jgi:hypothetical protein
LQFGLSNCQLYNAAKRGFSFTYIAHCASPFGIQTNQTQANSALKVLSIKQLGLPIDLNYAQLKSWALFFDNKLFCTGALRPWEVFN